MNNETKNATATHTGSIVAKSPAFSALSKERNCNICNRVEANVQKMGVWYHAACLSARTAAAPVSKAGEAALERSKLVRMVVEEANAKVAETPVIKAPAKVSEARAEVSKAPAKVSEARAEVSKAPAKVSEAPAKVSESAKTVVVSDSEEDTPGCPILAISIQDEKAVDQLEVITKDFKEYLNSLPADQRYTCIEAASAHVGKLEDECNIMRVNLPTAEQYKATLASISNQMMTNLTHQGEFANQIRLRDDKKTEWKNAQKIAFENEDASKDDELANIANSLKKELDQFPKDLEKQRQDAVAQGNELNQQLQKHSKYDMAVLKQNLDAWTTFVDGLRTVLIGVDAGGISWDGGSHESGMIFDYDANTRFTADQIKNFRDCLRHHLEHTLTDERIEEVVQKNYHDVPASLLQTIKSLYDPAMHFGQQNRALFYKGVIDNGQPYEGFNPWTVCADEEVLAGAAKTVAKRAERSEDEETERSDDDEGEEHESEDDEGEEHESEDDEGEHDEKESSPTTKADIFGEESCDEESPALKTPKRMSPTEKAAEIAKAQKQEAEALKAAQAQAAKDKAAEAEADKAAKAAEAEAAKAAKAKAAEADKAAKAQAAKEKAEKAEADKAAKAKAAEAAKAKPAEAAKAEAAKPAKAKASKFTSASLDDEKSDSDAEEIAKPLKRDRESTDAQKEGKRLMAQAATTLRNIDSKDIQQARTSAGRSNPARTCSTPTSNVHFTLSGKCGAWESVTSSTQAKYSGDTIERAMEQILCKSKKGQQSCCGGTFIANRNTTVVIICNSIGLSQNTGNYEANVQAIETYTKEGTDPVYFVAYVYNGKACYNMVYPPEEKPAPKRARKSK